MRFSPMLRSCLMRLVKKLHGCPASEMHSCALLLSACGQQNMGVHKVVGDVWGQTDVRRPPTHNVSLRFSGIGRCGSTDCKPRTLGEDLRVTPPEWQQSKGSLSPYSRRLETGRTILFSFAVARLLRRTSMVRSGIPWIISACAFFARSSCGTIVSILPSVDGNESGATVRLPCPP